MKVWDIAQHLLLASIGGLFVAVFNSFATVYIEHKKRAEERRKWVVDNRMKEFKELLDAVSSSHADAINVLFGDLIPPTADETLDRIDRDIVKIFNDRIYIASDLNLEELRDSWIGAIRRLRSHKVAPQELRLAATYFNKEFESIRKRITAAAHKYMPER